MIVTLKETYLPKFLCSFEHSDLGSSPSQGNGCCKSTNPCPHDTNMNVSVTSLLLLELVRDVSTNGDLPL